MGLQDRDYYQERHQNRTAQENAELFKQSGNRPIKFKIDFTSLKYAFSALLIFSVFIYNADVLLHKIEARKARGAGPIMKIPFLTTPTPPEMIPGGIILRANHQGHYTGTVFINNVPMRFMIDTGATDTVIPIKMAQAIGLPFGETFQSKTAGGLALGYQTHIDSLKIGTAEIKNLDASINPYLDEALIGMNTLKYFRITKDVSTLTLVAFTKPEEMTEIAMSLTAPTPTHVIEIPDFPMAPVAPSSFIPPHQGAKTQWKKTVICEGAKCKTSYGKAR